MVLPGVSELRPEKSSKRIWDNVTTLIVVIDGVAPVNKEESPVSVKVPVVVLMVPTLPVICEGHKRTKSVVTVGTLPLVETIPGRICTSCPTKRSAPLEKLAPEILKPPSSPNSSPPTWNTAPDWIVTTTGEPSEIPVTVGSSLN